MRKFRDEDWMILLNQFNKGIILQKSPWSKERSLRREREKENSQKEGSRRRKKFNSTYLCIKIERKNNGGGWV